MRCRIGQPGGGCLAANSGLLILRSLDANVTDRDSSKVKVASGFQGIVSALSTTLPHWRHVADRRGSVTPHRMACQLQTGPCAFFSSDQPPRHDGRAADQSLVILSL